MGFRIDLDFYGDKQVSRTIQRMTERVRDVSPAWEELANMFAGIEAAQFGSEGSFASGGWAPLSPPYAAWKARHYPGQPILVRTGALRDSLVTRPFGVEQIGPQDMAIGSNVDYGGFHQRGDGVPQRRPVELTDAHRQMWVKVLQRFIFGSPA